MTSVDMGAFLDTLTRSKQPEPIEVPPLMLDRAQSDKVPVATMPTAYRNSLDEFAAVTLDADNRGIMVMGFPKTGKTFLIEQLLHNLDHYLPKSTLKDLQAVYVNDMTLMQMGDTRNVRAWVQQLEATLGVAEENLCFVTESVEGAVLFYTYLSKAKVILEVNFDTFMMIRHNSSRSASKMWNSWAIIDTNVPRFTEQDVAAILNQSIVQRLNKTGKAQISKAQVNSFVKTVGRTYPQMFTWGEEGEKYSVAPMGAWAFVVKQLFNSLVFLSDEEYLKENGALNYSKVVRKTLEEFGHLFELFLEHLAPSSDEANEEEGLIPREIFSILTGEGGQRVVTMGGRVQQKEATPLVFNEVMTLSNRLKKTIMGQEAAVEQVATSLVVPAAGLHDAKRPLKSFLFLGPTGVGKTQLALDLANEVAAEPLKVIRIDMSEYQHEHEVAKLFGAPPGYVGFERGGRLTSAVAENPHALVLLDEVEKAHPKIWDTFLQVFDSGHMTDAQGNTVDFTQTIIVMTSNLGVAEITKTATGFGLQMGKEAYESRQKNASRVVMNAVEKFFRPEFINRIDEVVMFNELSTDVMTSIIRREIDLVGERAKSRGVKLTAASDAVISTLLQKSDISKYGAREIQRVVFRNVSNPVASFMVMNPSVKALTLATNDNEISVHKTTPERRKNG